MKLSLSNFKEWWAKQSADNGIGFVGVPLERIAYNAWEAALAQQAQPEDIIGESFRALHADLMVAKDRIAALEAQQAQPSQCGLLQADTDWRTHLAELVDGYVEEYGSDNDEVRWARTVLGPDAEETPE